MLLTVDRIVWNNVTIFTNDLYRDWNGSRNLQFFLFQRIKQNAVTKSLWNSSKPFRTNVRQISILDGKPVRGNVGVLADGNGTVSMHFGIHGTVVDNQFQRFVNVCGKFVCLTRNRKLVFVRPDPCMLDIRTGSGNNQLEWFTSITNFFVVLTSSLNKVAQDGKNTQKLEEFHKHFFVFFFFFFDGCVVVWLCVCCLFLNCIKLHNISYGFFNGFKITFKACFYILHFCKRMNGNFKAL